MTTAMPRSDFWKTSGYGLLDRDADGRLRVTDDFLRAYLLRAELAPAQESCPAELALHKSLMADPLRPVSDAQIAALADQDTRENYQVLLRFRDELVSAGSLEGWYTKLVRAGTEGIPALFIDHVVHAILRRILRDCDDPIRARAAELLFRTQKVTLRNGAILVADEEQVDQHAATQTPIARLMAEAGASMGGVELDVLDEANGELYWPRSDRFDTVLDLSYGRAGLPALCRVLEAWVACFLGTAVEINPVQAIQDERWSWHTGLDTESSAILNDLYEGHEVDGNRMARLLALFRLEFADPADMLERVAGAPVYLGLAMSADHLLRLKPQNLLLNLPLAKAM